MENKIREDFERWIVTERNQSVERYDAPTYAYKNTDVLTLWEAWKAAYRYYRIYKPAMATPSGLCKPDL